MGLGQQICQWETMASFYRQWLAGGMSQETGLHVGQSSFQNQRPSGCYREVSAVPGAAASKKPFMGLQPRGRGEHGFLRPQLWRLLAHRFTRPPARQRRIVVPAPPGSRSPVTTSPAMQTLFNEKANSYSALPSTAGQTYPSSLGLHWPGLERRKDLFMAKVEMGLLPGNYVTGLWDQI